MMVVEACGHDEVVWSEPRDIDVRQQSISVNAPGRRPGHSVSILSSYHSGGAHVAKADGSVAFLSSNMDPEVLRSLTMAFAADRRK